MSKKKDPKYIKDQKVKILKGYYEQKTGVICREPEYLYFLRTWKYQVSIEETIIDYYENELGEE